MKNNLLKMRSTLHALTAVRSEITVWAAAHLRTISFARRGKWGHAARAGQEDSVITVRNPAGSAAALALTPLTGGTSPVSAHLVIMQLQ